MTFLYKELDFLPQIPQHIVDRAIAKLEEEDKKPEVAYKSEELNNGVWFRPLDVNGDGKTVKSRSNILFPFDDAEFEQWFRENISTNFKTILLGISYPGEDASITTPPHTDLHRAYNMLYLISTSSPEQTTCFWQEDGYDAIRPLATFKSDFKNLNKIGEVKFKRNTWNALSTCVLHSVHNVTGKLHGRLAIHVSLYEDPTHRPDFFDSYLKKQGATK